MPDYCGIQDVINELTPTMYHAMKEQYELAHQYDPNRVDFDSQIQHNILQAQMFVDAKLGAVFKVPLPKVVQIITDVTARIAAWISGENIAAKESVIQSKYDSARVVLQDIVDAKQIPGLTDDENEELLKGLGTVLWKSRRPEYSEIKLASWDSDRYLDDCPY
jgi:phage gp36-like protein